MLMDIQLVCCMVQALNFYLQCTCLSEESQQRFLALNSFALVPRFLVKRLQLLFCEQFYFIWKMSLGFMSYSQLFIIKFFFAKPGKLSNSYIIDKAFFQNTECLKIAKILNIILILCIVLTKNNLIIMDGGDAPFFQIAELFGRAFNFKFCLIIACFNINTNQTSVEQHFNLIQSSCFLSEAASLAFLNTE